jgi:hypothetical protein
VNFQWEIYSIFNNFSTINQNVKINSMCPFLLIIEGFPTIPNATKGAMVWEIIST